MRKRPKFPPFWFFCSSKPLSGQIFSNVVSSLETSKTHFCRGTETYDDDVQPCAPAYSALSLIKNQFGGIFCVVWDGLFGRSNTNKTTEIGNFWHASDILERKQIKKPVYRFMLFLKFCCKMFDTNSNFGYVWSIAAESGLPPAGTLFCWVDQTLNQ